jgi:hypothetical protein
MEKKRVDKFFVFEESSVPEKLSGLKVPKFVVLR